MEGLKMNITEKLNEGVATLTSTVKSGVDTCVLEGKILDRQNKIKKLTKEIGNLAIFRLDAGEQMGSEIMERYSTISELRKEIEALENTKGAPSAVCPKCGEKVSAGMSFCGKCGAELNTDDAAETEEVE
jgi:hypothetical protein